MTDVPDPSDLVDPGAYGRDAVQHAVLRPDPDPAPPNQDLMCEVCQREPAVGVASSSMAAMSLAYGRTCLDRNADATFILAGNFYSIGPDPNDYADWIWDFTTFVDGEYITARDFFDRVTKEPGFFDPPPEDAP